MIYIATYIRKLKDRNGSFIAPATRSGAVYLSTNQTLDDVLYPVGFIYQSTSSTSPASLFGGDWEKIEGRFLIGSSSSYSVTSTGGEASHALRANEIPNHTHTIAVDNGPGGSPYTSYTYEIVTESVQWCGPGTSYNTSVSTGLSAEMRNPEDGPYALSLIPPYYAVNIWRRTA